MKNVYLIRNKTSDMGTEGILITSDGYNCKTFELPWRDNRSNISCIPSGAYDVEVRWSQKYKKVYWVRKVPSRTYILIHSGNFAGDKEFGFKTHVAGCILLGKRFGTLGDQRAILNSRVAVRAFTSHMAWRPFKLQVIGGDY